MKAVIWVFAQTRGHVKIALIYAVPWAAWSAFYDIRVDVRHKDDPITLDYKAVVIQNTGVAWDEVPLSSRPQLLHLEPMFHGIWKSSIVRALRCLLLKLRPPL
ncbi:hypothetical protein FB451DRAFT_1277059 [Mycena latifolia]|nr:hypothetical protein FB451DRAFT_1277059 [Mycena latifolia]